MPRRARLPASRSPRPGVPAVPRAPRAWRRVLIALVAVLAAACGKKGPPLTPFVYVPGEVGGMTARRVGSDVYVTMTVPAQNLDTSKPAAISRIDVFATTALTPPSRARFLEIAERVATIPVAPVPLPGQPPRVLPALPGAGQGAMVTIRDTLSADDLQPRQLQPLQGARPAPAGAPVAPAASVLRRFYLAIPYSPGGIPGPGAITELVITALPEPPPAVRVSQAATAALVEWEPAGGLIGWLLDNRAVVPERRPSDDAVRPPPPAASVSAELPGGPTTYNVYQERAPDPLAPPLAQAPGAEWQARPPVAIATGLTALTHRAPIELDERHLCYTVRAVRGGVESEPSPRACITPFDVYGPAPPTGVTAAAAEGEITIVWDPNTETDLGGYIVLRREAGNATLLPLAAAPIADSRYVDRQVKAGVQYFYAVVAVDQRLPLPNRSELSAEVAETAR